MRQLSRKTCHLGCVRFSCFFFLFFFLQRLYLLVHNNPAFCARRLDSDALKKCIEIYEEGLFLELYSRNSCT